MPNNKECSVEKNGCDGGCMIDDIEPPTEKKEPTPPQSTWEVLRAGYEEVQMIQSSIENVYPEAYRLARKFHELYEQQAPFFGYITNPNSREFYPNSNNARLMAYVCYNIVQEEIESILSSKQQEIEGAVRAKKHRCDNAIMTPEREAENKARNEDLEIIKTIMEQ